MLNITNQMWSSMKCQRKRITLWFHLHVECKKRWAHRNREKRIVVMRAGVCVGEMGWCWSNFQLYRGKISEDLMYSMVIWYFIYLKVAKEIRSELFSSQKNKWQLCDLLEVLAKMLWKSNHFAVYKCMKKTQCTP